MTSQFKAADHVQTKDKHRNFKGRITLIDDEGHIFVRQDYSDCYERNNIQCFRENALEFVYNEDIIETLQSKITQLEERIKKLEEK